MLATSVAIILALKWTEFNLPVVGWNLLLREARRPLSLWGHSTRALAACLQVFTRLVFAGLARLFLVIARVYLMLPFESRQIESPCVEKNDASKTSKGHANHLDFVLSSCDAVRCFDGRCYKWVFKLSADFSELIAFHSAGNGSRPISQNHCNGNQ